MEDDDNNVAFSVGRKGADFNDYVQIVIDNREKQRLDNKGKKIAITEYSLDNWFAQNFGIDINNMPAYRPPNVDKRVYDVLKRKYKGFANDKADKKAAGQQQNNKTGQVEQLGSDEEIQITEKKLDFKNLKPDQLKPYIYPKS